MKTVLGYLRPYAGRAACGVLIKFSAAVLELILPLLLANVIDVLVPARDLPAIWRTGGLMLGLAFGGASLADGLSLFGAVLTAAFLLCTLGGLTALSHSRFAPGAAGERAQDPTVR